MIDLKMTKEECEQMLLKERVEQIKTSIENLKENQQSKMAQVKLEYYQSILKLLGEE